MNLIGSSDTASESNKVKHHGAPAVTSNPVPGQVLHSSTQSSSSIVIVKSLTGDSLSDGHTEAEHSHQDGESLLRLDHHAEGAEEGENGADDGERVVGGPFGGGGVDDKGLEHESTGTEDLEDASHVNRGTTNRKNWNSSAISSTSVLVFTLVLVPQADASQSDEFQDQSGPSDWVLPVGGGGNTSKAHDVGLDGHGDEVPDEADEHAREDEESGSAEGGEENDEEGKDVGEDGEGKESVHIGLKNESAGLHSGRDGVNG